MYAVIMAGGRGTRFWPRSRQHTPKQLLNIAGRDTMLRETVARIRPLVPPEQTLVVIGPAIEVEVRRQLPEVPARNIIVEPQGRNTAAAIGLAAIHIQQQDSEEVMAVLPADHVIQDRERFRQALTLAQQMALQGPYLVTLGIRPTRPETGYGYIHRGEGLTNIEGQPIFQVQEFTEKPDPERARSFITSGEYFWNSGMFCWRVSTILENLRVHLPQLYQGLMEIESALGTRREADVLREVYQRLEDISIDYGVMEKAKGTVVIPADFDWNDVGSWAALDQVWAQNSQGNVLVGEHLPLDTRDSIIFSPDKVVAVIGLEGIIIVETQDALLVCPKDRAQEVKRIVELLEEKGLTQLL